MERNIVLEAQDLTRKVSSPEGELTIVDNVSLAIAEGESVALVGASGAGKSTLLAMLAGLDIPTAGRIWLDGRELSAMDEDARARVRADRVGFVFQAFHLVPSLTALENVMLPMELTGRGDARRAAHEILQRVGLSAREGHYPRQLSGGEQQRVAVARALANKPRLVLADEPTGNLDEKTADIVLGEFMALVRDQGSAALVATHNERLAAKMDRVVRLHDGVLA